MQLKGKTVLLTGGTDGIGRALALQLREQGATVLIVGRNPSRCESMRSNGFEVVEADLLDQAGFDAVVEFAGTRVDILINNAGFYLEDNLGDTASIGQAQRQLTLNLQRPIELTMALLPQLRVRSEAMIVNVTSGLAIAPNDHATYCASKAGLRAYTMSLRYQLRGTGVHVLEALPPMVDTQMNASQTGKKMPAPECARQIVHAMSSNAEEVNIGVVKLLRVIYSLSPALARRLMIAS